MSYQGGGGFLEATKNVTRNKLGANILLAGLVIQTVSFAFFMVLVVHAWHNIVKDRIRPRQEPWGPVLWILMFSSIAYMVYRLIISLFTSTDHARYRFAVSIVLSSLLKGLVAISLRTKVSV